MCKKQTSPLKTKEPIQRVYLLYLNYIYILLLTELNVTVTKKAEHTKITSFMYKLKKTQHISIDNYYKILDRITKLFNLRDFKWQWGKKINIHIFVEYQHYI